MAFPTTSVLDNFNRADETPLAGGWKNTPVWFGVGLGQVSSNQLANISTNAHPAWNTNFGNDQEVFITLSNKTDLSAMDLYVRGSDWNSPTFINTMYSLSINSSGGFKLVSTVGGNETDLATTTLSLSNGDSIGLACIGTTIQGWHKPSGGSWTKILEVTDSSITSGALIGLAVSTTNTATTRMDDFGGGNVVSTLDKSQSQTGSPAEARVLANAITGGSETASPAETRSAVVNLSQSETGDVTESFAPQNAVLLGETASPSEGIGLAITIVRNEPNQFTEIGFINDFENRVAGETGFASEAVASQVSLERQETGAGAENFSYTGSYSQSEQGAPVDDFTPQNNTSLNENPTPQETDSLTVSLTSSETGLASESVALANLFERQETANPSESFGYGASLTHSEQTAPAESFSKQDEALPEKTVSETGLPSESQSVAVLSAQSETGFASEARIIESSFSQSEAASPAEAPSSAVSLVESESGYAAEAILSGVSAVLGEAGLGSIGFSVQTTLTVAESGKPSEQIIADTGANPNLSLGMVFSSDVGKIETVSNMLDGKMSSENMNKTYSTDF